MVLETVMMDDACLIMKQKHASKSQHAQLWETEENL